MGTDLIGDDGIRDWFRTQRTQQKHHNLQDSLGITLHVLLQGISTNSSGFLSVLICDSSPIEPSNLPNRIILALEIFPKFNPFFAKNPGRTSLTFFPKSL